MYSRDARRGERISIPENYSGAAFRGGIAEGLFSLNRDEPEVADVSPHDTQSDGVCGSCSIPPSLHREIISDVKDESSPSCRRCEGADKGLFGKEELLILGVALLMGRTGFDTDTLMLMLLLLI